MKYKGFTIVEILVAIVILGILLLIAIPSYINITNSGKQKALDNKIQSLEIASEKWGDELNLSAPITIPVLQLVYDGYISSDDVNSDKVINPVDSSDMSCNAINISFSKNQIVATFSDEVIDDCSVKYELEDEDGLKFDGYKVVNGVIGDKLELISGLSEFVWINTDVLLVLDVDDGFSVKEGSDIVFTGGGVNKSSKYSDSNFCDVSNVDINNVDDCSNMLLVSADNSIISIYGSILTNEGFKTKVRTLKIDKIPPVIEVDVDNSEYINKDREVNIEYNDGVVGSGINSLRINDINVFLSNNGLITVTRDNGDYVLYVYDNAGNEAKMPFNVSKVDKTLYTISVVNGDGGVAYSSKDSSLFGNNISLSFVPNVNYEVDKMYVNGVLLNSDNFIMPRENTVVEVYFKLSIVTKYRTRSSVFISGHHVYPKAPIPGYVCDNGNRCQYNGSFYVLSHPYCINNADQPIFSCERSGYRENGPWSDWGFDVCTGEHTCEIKRCLGNSPEGMCYEVE